MKVILPILPKIGSHGNVPWGIKKLVGLTTFTQIPSSWWKIVRIGPVDPEMALLKLKKKRKVKYIARSASLLSGLKNLLAPFYGHRVELLYRMAQNCTSFVCLNFIKYYPVFKIILLSESGENL